MSLRDQTARITNMQTVAYLKYAKSTTATEMHILASFTKLIDIDCFDSIDIQQNSTITETACCVNIPYD